jgi:hypothetical protein
MACSPRQRILACVLLCRRCHRLRRRLRKGTRMEPPAPWYALSAQHLTTSDQARWRNAAGVLEVHGRVRVADRSVPGHVVGGQW